MITRDFYRQIMASKLCRDLSNWSDKFGGIQVKPSGNNHFIVLLNEDLTPQEDIALAALVQGHIPSDSFVDEKELTDTRNKEGFDLYKQIFAHISDNEPITNIDSFIAVSEQLHRLRNYLKDGNFETAIRHMELSVKPIATGQDGLFPNGYETYRQWVREIAIKYNSALTLNCGLVNPAFVGGPFESVPFIDYIEQAPQGMV
jgi:hypothetical protein